jgi:hypothetical protein
VFKNTFINMVQGQILSIILRIMLKINVESKGLRMRIKAKV